MIKRPKKPFTWRFRLAKRLQEEGNISPVVREFGTTGRRFRKWAKRYSEVRVIGLPLLLEKDKSKVPRKRPHWTSKRVERRVLKFRSRDPSFGKERSKLIFALPCSTAAILGILKQNGRMKIRLT